MKNKDLAIKAEIETRLENHSHEHTLRVYFEIFMPIRSKRQ